MQVPIIEEHKYLSAFGYVLIPQEDLEQIVTMYQQAKAQRDRLNSRNAELAAQVDHLNAENVSLAVKADNATKEIAELQAKLEAKKPRAKKAVAETPEQEETAPHLGTA
jgi:chromosome segregation ATPase